MDFTILSSTQEVFPFLTRIASIADGHRDEFGFLPFSAYEERALRNQLWVATNADHEEILGYLVLGGGQSSVTIVQLYVDPRARRRRVGSTLVQKLKDHARANHVQLIKARVASDLSANPFWESQGFYIIQQIPGGRTRKRTINVRIHELPMNSLWSESQDSDVTDWLQTPASTPLLSSPTYALDLNVLFDVIRNRPEADLARKVFSAALHGDFRLCISQEFAEELARHSSGADSDPVLQLARELPTLPRVELAQLDRSIGVLRRIVFPDRDVTRRDADNDRSDLRHLAICHYHGVGGFVTRERAILRAAPTLADKLGIRVLSPLDLVNPADALDPAEVGTDILVGSTGIRIVDYEPSYRGAVEQLIQRIGVPTSTLDTLLEAGTSARSRTRSIVLSEERLVACASWTNVHPAGLPVRAYLFVDESAARAQLVVDHLLGSFLRSITDGRLVSCELMTARSQLTTRSTARLLGFSRTLSHADPLVGLAKLARRGLVGPREWPEFCAQFLAATGTKLPKVCPFFAEATSTGLVLGKTSTNRKPAIELMAFETELAPLIVLAPGRKVVLVPIRDKLACELLPGVAFQNPLFPKEATAHLERAYFGKAVNASLFERGTLVVFCISLADGGRGEAVGVGRVTSSGSGSPVNLNLSLLRQGVLGVGDLEQLATGSGQIGYFTFDSFTKFARPIPRARLSELGCIGGLNLVTSQELEFDKFLTLIERSHGAGEDR